MRISVTTFVFAAALIAIDAAEAGLLRNSNNATKLSVLQKWLGSARSFFLSTSKNKDNVDGGKHAWVTVLTDSNFNNTQLAATQILSVQKYSKHKHISLVLPLVDDDTRGLLEELGSSVVEVSRILPPFKIQAEWFQDIFSRLHLWNLLEFEQITYMDADAFLMNKNADQIFNECDKDFCAVGRDKISGLETHLDAQLFNAGVMVIRPNKNTYEYLVHEALPVFKHDGIVAPDEHFLADVYFHMKPNLRTSVHYHFNGGGGKLIDYKYNSCSSEFADKCDCQNHYEKGHLFIDGSDCQKEIVDRVSIYHHCGSIKISSAPLCEWGGKNTPSYCEMEHIKVFQDLLVQANPCTLGNQGADECGEKKRCKWDQSLRCIPNDHSDDLNSIEQSTIRIEPSAHRRLSGYGPIKSPKSPKATKPKATKSPKASKGKKATK